MSSIVFHIVCPPSYSLLSHPSFFALALSHNTAHLIHHDQGAELEHNVFRKLQHYCKSGQIWCLLGCLYFLIQQRSSVNVPGWGFVPCLAPRHTTSEMHKLTLTPPVKVGSEKALHPDSAERADLWAYSFCWDIHGIKDCLGLLFCLSLVSAKALLKLETVQGSRFQCQHFILNASQDL